MSWAARNPEKWDEICRQGMADMLVGNPDTLDWLLDQLQSIAIDDKSVSDTLDEIIGQSFLEISQAEGSYLSGGY